VAELTKESIAKLREELTRDLEALERVERLLAGRNGSSSSHEVKPQLDLSKYILPPPPTFPLTEITPPETFEGLGLKQLVIRGLQLVGITGAAPKDLVIFCKEKGYSFTSDANASASITTALSRLMVNGKVRRENGRYHWIAG
jgi:hypothetical protein